MPVPVLLVPLICFLFVDGDEERRANFVGMGDWLVALVGRFDPDRFNDNQQFGIGSMGVSKQGSSAQKKKQQS